MKFLGDYHTHTVYSDAVNTVEDVAQCAIRQGLKQVAITDHGFLNKWMSLTPRKFEKEIVEVVEVRKRFPQIDILQGIEANLMDILGTVDLFPEQVDKLDVLVMGFHRFADSTSYKDYFRFIIYNGFVSKVFKPTTNAITRNTDAFIKALEFCPVDILAHINEHAKVDAKVVAQAAAEFGTFIELNVRHIDLLDACMDDLLSTNCQFIVNTDSHKPENIGKFDAIFPLIEKYQIPEERIANLNKLPEFKRTAAYKRRNKNGK